MNIYLRVNWFLIIIFSMIPIIAFSQQLQLVKACTGSVTIDTLLKTNNKMYFTSHYFPQHALWVTDGTPNNTKSISYEGSFLKILATNQDKLYFVTNSIDSSFVWVTNGLDTTAVKLGSFEQSQKTKGFFFIANIGNKTYFNVNNYSYVWVTDGTIAGTINTGINLGIGNQSFRGSEIIEQIGDKYIFKYLCDSDDIFITDWTPAGTKLIAEFSVPSQFNGFYKCNGNYFTFFSEKQTGTDLYKFDFDSSKLVIIKDIDSGNNYSYVKNLFILRDTLFFTCGNPDEYLWKSDGTYEGTQVVTLLTHVSVANLKNQFFPLNDKFCFDGDDGIHGIELWMTDGTKEGTKMIYDIYPEQRSSSPIEPFLFGDKLYFSADDGIHGRQLWITDGTYTGTYLVKDLGFSMGSFPEKMLASNGLVYFTVDGDSYLYRTDGTEIGTISLMKAQEIFADKVPFTNFVTFHNKLYFYNLYYWETDGTVEGTRSLLSPYNDLNYKYSNPKDPLEFNNSLYFVVGTRSDLPYINNELWKLEPITDVPTENQNNNISIYPNPVTDYLSLKSDQEIGRIEIFSELGIKLLETEYTNRIDVSSFPMGTYFLEAGFKMFKFVKM